jgi:hypothetical protein
MMSTTREAYLVAALSAADLLRDPVVARSWESSSALTGFSVGGLAAHLAAQVVFVVDTLDAPHPEGETVSLLGHYERVKWIGADLEADVNVAIRDSGERSAAAGPAEVTQRVSAALRRLDEALPAEPADRRVSPPAGPWALTLDDFLVTRMMEIAVHSDDLAVSVGVPTPELPSTVIDPVVTLLAGLAVRRHGPSAVVRALSRAERAPVTIAAF